VPAAWAFYIGCHLLIFYKIIKNKKPFQFGKV
jgi:hypothetical protein